MEPSCRQVVGRWDEMDGVCALSVFVALGQSAELVAVAFDPVGPSELWLRTL